MEPISNPRLELDEAQMRSLGRQVLDLVVDHVAGLSQQPVTGVSDRASREAVGGLGAEIQGEHPHLVARPQPVACNGTDLLFRCERSDLRIRLRRNVRATASCKQGE